MHSHRKSLARLAGLLVGGSMMAAAPALAASAEPLVLDDIGSFFVGGDSVHTDATSGNPKGPAGIGYRSASQS